MNDFKVNNTYSMSLFDSIPPRDCEETGIPANWCLCYKWHSIDVGDPKSKALADYAVSMLNNFVRNGTSMCQTLSLKKINTAQIAEFSTTTIATYRIVFEADAPRSMVFRATIIEEHEKFWMEQWDIEQISEWGKYVKCKPNDVRPPMEPQFCLCK